MHYQVFYLLVDWTLQQREVLVDLHRFLPFLHIFLVVFVDLFFQLEDEFPES